MMAGRSKRGGSEMAARVGSAGSVMSTTMVLSGGESRGFLPSRAYVRPPDSNRSM